MAIIKKFRIKSFKNKNPFASFKKVSLSFDKRQILNDVSFDVNSGEILGLLGPNGAGKSTIFNTLIGLIKPDFGKVLFENIDATNYPIYQRTVKFKIGYVPQYGGYFHDLTLLENLKAIAEILIEDKNQRINKINELIFKFELDNVREIKAKFLSGGQRRKLVICLALLGNPKILLCDEIFAALDVLTIHMLKEILVNLQKENPKICIVICEHQARELLSIVDRALILSNCNIIAEGTPSDLMKNQSAKSEYFGEFFKIN
ncbi:ATP-binding cassette domain-containing protein [Candidatus Pelagibacter sp.]|nr:ATP-binding cassette domain-containing protein [Candidatus Pelagibacter sp.]|tara:strand:+ start:167 stop:946 length:780 start_codon:yes stop_codon:yes gene_type:complete